MPLYPVTVKRCQHIKINGTQCGSPALHDGKFCYYHIRYHWPELEATPDNNEWAKRFPTLEDANSIQVELAHVMERLVMQEVDRESVANRPIGATAWSRIEGREYDDLSEDDLSEESDRKQPADSKRLQ
jgi:hypothetical protein